MTVRINKPVQGGIIKAISSKSEAQRLLICSALADRETFVECSDVSDDINAAVSCLEAMGAQIQYMNGGFFVSPILQTNDEKLKPKIELNCGESGAVLRFLLPICGSLGINASFNMKGRLPERPLTALRDEMTAKGCVLSEPGISPLNCSGKLSNGVYSLPGNISSQFISGLLFALPLLEEESIIRISGILESRPYIDMTLDAIRLFGINIIEEGQDFRIPGAQNYCSPGKVKAGGDWSNAAFWLAAGAIGNNALSCTGLDLDSVQGDKAIMGFLQGFGAGLSHDKNTVNVKRGKIEAIEIDASATPDLVPVLAAVASLAKGKTLIRNAGRLRIKESNRLHTVAQSLSGLGADIFETEDGLVITGKENLTGGEIQSYGDHRIAMTAAIISSACTGFVVIHGAEAVNKSYPAFFEDFKSLGGEFEYV